MIHSKFSGVYSFNPPVPDSEKYAFAGRGTTTYWATEEDKKAIEKMNQQGPQENSKAQDDYIRDVLRPFYNELIKKAADTFE